MRFFSALFITVATAFTVRGAATLNATAAEVSSSLSVSLNKGNFYGAPIPPWKSGCSPGWYYGDHPDWLHISLPWLKDGLICWLLDLLHLGFLCPKTPHNIDGYKPIFSNYTGAVQADDYMTYGLVDTVEDCLGMCNSVDGCTFVNRKSSLFFVYLFFPDLLNSTYHDVNGKNGSPLLTCSLFTKCHGEEDADNFGGQTQPDGSIDFITDSAGYCKV